MYCLLIYLSTLKHSPQVYRFMLIITWIGGVLSCTPVFGQEGLLEKLMRLNYEKFGHILENPEKYEVQIIYSQVYRDRKGHVLLQDYTYRLNPKAYFNPASTVKLPVVALSLEKLNDLNIKGLDKYTRMQTEKAAECQTETLIKDFNATDYPSIARYIEKILLVSDNEAYTRLYEFLGQKYIHDKLKAKGYPTVRIIRRFSNCDSAQNRCTNPITFFNEKAEVLFHQPLICNSEPYTFPLGIIKKHKGYYTSEGKRVDEPIDYTTNNLLNLADLHQMVISIILPEAVAPYKRFHLTPDDYQFLRRAMGAYPREGVLATQYQPTKDPATNYYDTYKKYLYYGRREQPVEPTLRIYNIVGWYAGYLIDSAYFLDIENKVEFFLSAVIYANEDDILFNKEEYEEIGFPFLENLGKLIYQYERTQAPKILPEVPVHTEK
ncbi:MAG: class A beta-lactamase-related serine hydrolase [Microscillaceae bacterium]|nr:class A beta-lactamase-related serine hydrolase [Microscillaceae bacterium]MDW8460171.1 serine hydrolase [Cytophagales bacterium]